MFHRKVVTLQRIFSETAARKVLNALETIKVTFIIK